MTPTNTAAADARRTLPPRILVGAALLLAAIIAATIVIVLWDDDADPGQSKAEAAAVATKATAAREEFSRTLAPRKDVAATMVVPASEDWWSVVTGLGAQVKLDEADAPAGAAWLAYTSAEPRTEQSTGEKSYSAIYIGFETTDQAAAYEPSCVCNQLTRANTVTLTQANAYPTTETFRGVGDTIEAIDPVELDLQAGSWTIDLTAQIEQMLGTGSDYLQGQRQFFTALGADLDSPMRWSATSASPEGPWTGQLDGADLDAIDILGVGKAVGSTEASECARTTCTIYDDGIGEIVNAIWVTDDQYAFGDPALAPAEWVEDGIGKDVAVAGTVSNQSFFGAVTARNLLFDSQLNRVSFKLTDSRELTVLFDLKEDD